MPTTTTHDHDHEPMPTTTAATRTCTATAGSPTRHAPASGSTLSWRGLFALGLAGGLIPSTSALFILLGSIVAGRPAFGFVLVVVFGLGMAVVMTAIGLVVVVARGRLDGAAVRRPGWAGSRGSFAARRRGRRAGLRRGLPSVQAIARSSRVL